MSVIKQCGNCEFNFGGTCAGGDNGEHAYGAAIADETATCSGWGASLECFTEITQTAPWYLKEPYESFRIDYSSFEDLLEADSRGEAIEVNIYDAIKHIYKISLVDLAVVLGVSFNVIYRAKTHGTPEKRQVAFAKILCLPRKFFTQTTTHDFAELENCATVFASKIDVVSLAKEMPDWKQTVASEVSTILRCPIHIAKELARVDFLYWDATMPLENLLPCEKALIDYLNFAMKKSGKQLSRLEYSLDNGSHVRMRIY